MIPLLRRTVQAGSIPAAIRDNLLDCYSIHTDLLFKVISDRSEQSSTIVTTNLPFARWTELFENTTMVSALVDRLTYKSAVLDMNGPSYRLLSSQSKVDTDKENEND